MLDGHATPAKERTGEADPLFIRMVAKIPGPLHCAKFSWAMANNPIIFIIYMVQGFQCLSYSIIFAPKTS